MKTLLKTTLIACLLLIFSCGEEDSSEEEQQQLIPPTVTNMSPLSGPKTTVVTFTGTNFGSDANTVQVFFDDIEATVQSVTATQIQAVVPPRAFFGEVRLVINGTEFTGFNFEYEVVDIQVNTFAGSAEGFTDGIGMNAQFKRPTQITTHPNGSLYIIDRSNTIRKISPNMEVTSINIDLNPIAPSGIVVDVSENIYISDALNHLIIKITPNGTTSIFAGSSQGFSEGTGANAQFNNPRGMTIDESGNIFVCDAFNFKIRKITPNGVVSTLAGSTIGFADGTGSSAQFKNPSYITIDTFGNLYVADIDNHKIRKITTSGMVSTFAGSVSGFADGSGTNAQFNRPLGIDIDFLGNLFIGDSNNHLIRKITADGLVSTIAGNEAGFAEGTGANAQFTNPAGIVIDSLNHIYVCDAGNHKIRKITQE